jgi:hypothetical protein
MASNIIDINSDAFVTFTNKLEKLGRADLPVAIRGTLNQMAFDMKGVGGSRGEISKRAEQDFDYKRNNNLFKFMTGVDKARGLDIGGMKSEAGIVDRAGKGDLAEGLADQQRGGDTKQGATPLEGSRIGGNIPKKVRAASHLRKLNSLDLRRKKKGAFTAGAIKAKKANRTILVATKGGNSMIARIRGINKARGGVKIRLNWLYRINSGGTVKLKEKRPFVDNAARQVMKNGSKEFIKQAKRRIEKTLR